MVKAMCPLVWCRVNTLMLWSASRMQSPVLAPRLRVKRIPCPVGPRASSLARRLSETFSLTQLAGSPARYARKARSANATTFAMTDNAFVVVYLLRDTTLAAVYRPHRSDYIGSFEDSTPRRHWPRAGSFSFRGDFSWPRNARALSLCAAIR
jgi:hypothetical protein